MKTTTAKKPKTAATRSSNHTAFATPKFTQHDAFALRTAPGLNWSAANMQAASSDNHSSFESAHPIVQRAIATQRQQSEEDIHRIAAQGVQGQGHELPYFDRLQKAFAPHDLSHVQAFTDSNAANASQGIGAEAYATGNKIAFAETNPSLHTVAHETTHILQQQSGIQLKGGVGEVGDRYEKEADTVADKIVSQRNMFEGNIPEQNLKSPSTPHGFESKVQRSISSQPTNSPFSGYLTLDRMNQPQTQLYFDQGDKVYHLINYIRGSEPIPSEGNMYILDSSDRVLPDNHVLEDAALYKVELRIENDETGYLDGSQALSSVEDTSD